MTLKAGTNLNLSPYCDKILEFFYFRKSNGLIDIDIVDQELSLPYEYTEIALKKLESDGFIEVVRTSDSTLAKITINGEIHYRTSSYIKEFTKENAKSRVEKFRILKDAVQLITFLIAILVGLNNFTLNKDLEKIKKDIELINKKNTKSDSLKNQIENLKIKFELPNEKNSIIKTKK